MIGRRCFSASSTIRARSAKKLPALVYEGSIKLLFCHLGEGAAELHVIHL